MGDTIDLTGDGAAGEVGNEHADAAAMEQQLGDVEEELLEVCCYQPGKQLAPHGAATHCSAPAVCASAKLQCLGVATVGKEQCTAG